jgi:hypothetical protein
MHVLQETFVLVAQLKTKEIVGARKFVSCFSLVDARHEAIPRKNLRAQLGSLAFGLMRTYALL